MERERGTIVLSGDITWEQIDVHAKSIGKNRSSYTVELYKKDISGRKFQEHLLEYMFLMNLLAIGLLVLLALYNFGVIKIA